VEPLYGLVMLDRSTPARGRGIVVAISVCLEFVRVINAGTVGRELERQRNENVAASSGRWVVK
jgi:hypothetical protein